MFSEEFFVLDGDLNATIGSPKNATAEEKNQAQAQQIKRSFANQYDDVSL